MRATEACRWWAALALTGEQKEGVEDPIEMERLADEDARPRAQPLHRLRRPRGRRRAHRHLHRPRLHRAGVPLPGRRAGALHGRVRPRRPAAAARPRPGRGRLTWPCPAGSSATPASRSRSSRSGPGGRGSSSRASRPHPVLDHARSRGIDFLEVARYNDESGSAPIPSGYSEVVFGEAVPGVGLAARRGDDRREALVGALAAAETRRRSSTSRWSGRASTTSTSSSATRRRPISRWRTSSG